MVVSIELGGGYLMAHVPALFTNELISISGSYISHAARRLHRVHLGVDVGADLVIELSADLLSLGWALLRGAATVGDNWRPLGLIDNHEGVLLRRRASHQHFMCK